MVRSTHFIVPGFNSSTIQLSASLSVLSSITDGADCHHLTVQDILLVPCTRTIISNLF